MILLSPSLPLRPDPISSSSSSLSPLPLLLINGGPKSHCKARRSCSTVCLATKPLIKDRVLRVNGREALSGVPENVTLSNIAAAAAAAVGGEGSDSDSDSASASFLGAVAGREDCRHVFKIGVLRDCRLVCLFRFRIFWMIPRFGNSASDIPQETQMLLLEIKDDKSVSNEVDGYSGEPITYMLLLPVLDGLFRSSLQGNSSNELEFCIESGDPAVRESQFLEAVLVNYGNNPFDLMKESMKILAKHKGTFRVREHKKKPAMLDWFGWCTWDAFYFDVNPQGIVDGLKSLCEGGTPPRFLIIDDGWQDTENEFQKEGEPSAEGSQYGARLVSVRENSKFRNISLGPDEEFRSLKDFITSIKETFGLNMKVSAITRVSDDYKPRNQKSQTLHIAAVAFNSIFLGEVVVPDWDMFYSLHYAAEFHAAARALGGCGIYVSDKPNHHDFELLKKLVLPDGSILRAKYPGRPTRDCLFTDPVMDGKSLLKIWNLNACNGILGIFNCQGAGTWPCLESSFSHPNSEATTLSAKVRSDDIEYLEEVAGNNNWTGDCAVYSFNAGSLTRFPKNKSWSVTLKVLQCEIFTVSPIKAYIQNIQFAPIGLVKMYNSGGAVKAVQFADDCLVVEGRGCGLFGAYSSREPKSCGLNSEDKEFEFNNGNNLLTLMIPSGVDSWEIEIYF